MSEMALRSLISHAVVDDKMRSRLLTGERDRVFSQFELNEMERNALSGIRAGSLQSFAAQLDDWMRSQPAVAVGAKLTI
ncbi:MAG: hypothetical protein J7M39_05435 [Anaerolineae bacterium]|nr:hypothetical protein [Anaerolineae bacterium]